MLKIIFSGSLLALLLALAPEARAQGLALDCTADAAQCEGACDGEKRWGIFKGDRFGDCTARCEEQLARQCENKGDETAGAKTGKRRGDKQHPQDRQYGYEKNADKVKSRHGAAVSAEHRKDVEHRGMDGSFEESEVEVAPGEAEASETEEMEDHELDGGKIKEKAAKAKKTGKKDKGKSRKDRR